MLAQTQNRRWISRDAVPSSTVCLATVLLLLIGLSTQLFAATNSVTSCGTVISAAGTWALVNNLNCRGFAIAIQADGVVLRLNGFTISGPGVNSTTDVAGITVVSTEGTGLKNATINGPGTVMLFPEGIVLNGTNTGMVLDVSFVSNSVGLALNKDTLGVTPTSLLILQNNFQKNADGINAASLNSSTIAGNNFSSNSDGIQLSGSANRLVANTSSNNTHAGIVLSSNGSTGNTLESNRTEHNHFYGIALYSPANKNQLIGNVSFGNGFADMVDEDTDCGTNTYIDNLFLRADESCIK